MLVVDCRTKTDWLPLTVEALKYDGVAVVTGVLAEDYLVECRSRLRAAQAKILECVGRDKLVRAGELGVLRLMAKYDPFFLGMLAIPEMLAVVDATVSDTAILHLQNGFILPSFPEGKAPSVFQNRYHMDFPRVLNGTFMSVNMLFAVDEFTAANGGTLVVPGTHQKQTPPPLDYLRARTVAAECPAGSMLVFDSTLWHAAGANVSGRDRLGVNHQFTRSYVKQQIDYVRALGEEVIMSLPPRSQQLLGWYTRVVTSLDEYYRPEAERLYRRAQG